jgi:hypothetical protein
MARARMMGGKARKTSVIRIRVSSSTPPANPANAPRIVPIVAARAITISPTGIETRAP